MVTATTALIVSITSACITLGGLIWQFTLYRLSGARLRVELLFHYRGEGHAVVQTAGGRRRSRTDPRFKDHSPDLLGIEAVRVRVTNVGRSPVSVDEIALDVGPSRWNRLRRRSLTPPTFRDKDSKHSELHELSAPDGPHRLEAGDVTSRVFRLWPSLGEELERRGGEVVTVRGTARMAGRRRARLSPRRFAWTFHRGEETWFLDDEVTPEQQVYRVLWRRSLDEGVGERPLQMRHIVMRQLRSGASADDICATLQLMDDEGEFMTVAREVHGAFHKGTTETDRAADDANEIESARSVNRDDEGKQRRPATP